MSLQLDRVAENDCAQVRYTHSKQRVWWPGNPPRRRYDERILVCNTRAKREKGKNRLNMLYCIAGKPQRIVSIHDWVGKICTVVCCVCARDRLDMGALTGTFSFSCALTKTCMSVHVDRLDQHTRRVSSDKMVLEVAGMGYVGVCMCERSLVLCACLCEHCVCSRP
jgi:hypothetical protein